MKILQLKSENVKRLHAVDITPSSNTVVIGGLNGNGKSSVLDSITYALGGARVVPSHPIRRGENRAEIEIRLSPCPEKKIFDELIVKRVFTASGDTRLEIRSAAGMTASSPQTLLDSLTGRVGFDPLAFTRLKPGEQAAQLAGVVGLDLSDLERDRADVYQERHALNKQLTSVKADLERAPFYDGVEPVDASELVSELRRRQEVNQQVSQLETKARDLAQKAEHLQDKAEQYDREVERLKALLAETMENCRAAHAKAKEAILAAAKAEKEMTASARVDVGEIERKIEQASEINRQVDANRRRAELESRLSELDEESKYLTNKLAEIDQEKAKRLAAAAWPISGLGFGEEGVTLNGLPFEQASSAEQLAVSVAVGAALNPACRVLLIRDGSLLDSDSLQLVGELARKYDCQVWIERVSEGEECSLIIEDGMVAARREPSEVEA
jgi:hypothetical protein